MKNKKYAVAFLSILLTTGIEKTNAQTANKSLFVEVGGPGVFSLNFDSRFHKSPGGLGMRAGIGAFSFFGTSATFIPVGLNYLIGSDKRNYLELGAGGTFVNGHHFYKNTAFTSSFGHLFIGYRLQPVGDHGFQFRAGLCPVFSATGFVPYYFGASFGYAF